MNKDNKRLAPRRKPEQAPSLRRPIKKKPEMLALPVREMPPEVRRLPADDTEGGAL